MKEKNLETTINSVGDAPSLEKQCANSKIFQEKEANINNNKVKKHNELTK